MNQDSMNNNLRKQVQGRVRLHFELLPSLTLPCRAPHLQFASVVQELKTYCHMPWPSAISTIQRYYSKTKVH
jgi:hypothetical protein